MADDPISMLQDLTNGGSVPSSPSIEVGDEEHVGEKVAPTAPTAPTAPVAPLPPATPPPAQTPVQTSVIPTQGSPAPKTPAPTGGKGKGPQSPQMGKLVPRSSTIAQAQTGNGLAVPAPVQATQITLSAEEYENNLVQLLNQSISLASHDRAMALSMLQVHLDRGEELDKLPLSMPVSAAISDNTTACLKSMELAQKAGVTIFNSAKLLVDAKKADDTALIKAFQARLAEKKLQGDNDDGWDMAGDDN